MKRLLPLAAALLLSACDFSEPVTYCRYIERDNVKVSIRLNDEETFVAAATVLRVNYHSGGLERAGCYYHVAFDNPHVRPDVVLVHERYLSQ